MRWNSRKNKTRSNCLLSWRTRIKMSTQEGLLLHPKDRLPKKPVNSAIILHTEYIEKCAIKQIMPSMMIFLLLDHPQRRAEMSSSGSRFLVAFESKRSLCTTLQGKSFALALHLEFRIASWIWIAYLLLPKFRSKKGWESKVRSKASLFALFARLQFPTRRKDKEMKEGKF